MLIEDIILMYNILNLLKFLWKINVKDFKFVTIIVMFDYYKLLTFLVVYDII